MTTTPTPSPRLSLIKAYDRRWPDPHQRHALSGQLHAITRDWRVTRSWMAAAPAGWGSLEVLAAAQLWVSGVARIAHAYPVEMTRVDAHEAVAWLMAGFSPEQAVLARALVRLNSPGVTDDGVAMLCTAWRVVEVPAPWVVTALGAGLTVAEATREYDRALISDPIQPGRVVVDPTVVGTLELLAAVRGVDVRRHVINWDELSNVDL